MIVRLKYQAECFVDVDMDTATVQEVTVSLSTARFQDRAVYVVSTGKPAGDVSCVVKQAAHAMVEGEPWPEPAIW